MKNLLLSASLLFATATSASAYTSYLLPNDFWPDSSRVSVQAAFASNFFTPAIALNSDFVVVQPDGANGVIENIEIGGESTRLGTTLLHGGTYRFSTGERVGEVTTLVGVDGQWRPLAAGETPPEGAQTTTLQTVTVAEAYVTRGAPTRGAVDQPGGRLAIRPVTHPNQILVSDGFQVQLMFDGAPFPNMPIVVYASGQADSDTARYVVTDAAGNATITLDQPGQYVIAARHRAQAPAGSEAAVRSYTTSLTFDAMTALPEITEVADEETSSTATETARERRARRTSSRLGGIRR